MVTQNEPKRAKDIELIREIMWGEPESEAHMPPEHFSERLLNGRVYEWLMDNAPEYRFAPVCQYNWRKDALEVYAHLMLHEQVIRVEFDLIEEDSLDIATPEQLVERIGLECMKILREYRERI